MILNLKDLPPDSVSPFGAKASALGRLIHIVELDGIAAVIRILNRV
jgi:hypothetical protein